MTKEELYYGMLSLLATEYDENTTDYVEHVRSLFEKYREIINRLDAKDRPLNYARSLQDANNSIETLLQAINFYYAGLYIQAYESIKDHLDQCKHIYCYLGGIFFRMRVAENRVALPQEEIFHIPFDKRAFIATERYSSPGLPCLYLGSTCYTCWKELSEPELQDTYVSAFKGEQINKYLNMTAPVLKTWNDNNEKTANAVFNHDIAIFPYIISSMVKVANRNASFKPEYIVPQLVMHWVIERYYSGIDSKKDQLIGVAYTSVFFDPSSEHGVLLNRNIAIPAYVGSNKYYSDLLRDRYSFSNPVCMLSLKNKLAVSNPYTSYFILDKELSDDTLFPRYKLMC